MHEIVKTIVSVSLPLIIDRIEDMRSNYPQNESENASDSSFQSKSDSSDENNELQLLPVAMYVADILAVTIPLAPAIPIAVAIARLLVDKKISKIDLEDPSFLQQVDLFSEDISVAFLSSSDRDEQIAVAVGKAVEGSMSMPERVRSAFLAVVLGVASSASYDLIKKSLERAGDHSVDVSKSIALGGKLLVTGDGLRVRTAPNLDAKIVGTLRIDTHVVFYSETDGWTYIKSDNLYGWVKSDYISSAN